jgi:hypothetical protein
MRRSILYEIKKKRKKRMMKMRPLRMKRKLTKILIEWSMLRLLKQMIQMIL